MRAYRFLTRDGEELGTLTTGSLAEAIASAEASRAPLEAQIVAGDSSTVLARKEMWAGEHPGWSLMLRTPGGRGAEAHAAVAHRRG